jgi:hypothetical protein
MLVLALQFSKGSARGRTHDDYLTHSHRWEHVIGRVGSCRAHRGQRELVLHAGAEVEDPIGSAPSKRKRRQSSSSRHVKRTNPAIDLPFRLTHQCTNWEWFEPGRTNAYQRLNCSP